MGYTTFLLQVLAQLSLIKYSSFGGKLNNQGNYVTDNWPSVRLFTYWLDRDDWGSDLSLFTAG